MSASNNADEISREQLVLYNDPRERLQACPTGSKFLGLPCELRQLTRLTISSYVVGDNRAKFPIFVLNLYSEPYVAKIRSSPASWTEVSGILGVNPQVHSEALDAMYKGNTFCIELDGSNRSDLMKKGIKDDYITNFYDFLRATKSLRKVNLCVQIKHGKMDPEYVPNIIDLMARIL
ncbi:hypothetical protein N0V90_001400 [Kalmusia sp. IMI 367209]|nr:hypothetical protein N0V90_001400 [Kalmusia sp. IMI 367209]